MQCPKCRVTMREREQGNVIVDICPQCRGVWLDPGELEKLSEREQRYYDDDDYDDDWEERRRGDERSYEPERRSGGARPRKKQGFLSSLMESFGGEGGGD